jgi:hypothetical protein
MADDPIKLKAQLMAIEHLLTTLYAEMHVRKGRSLHDVKALHKRMLDLAQQETFPGAAPELSDHAAAEYETELERLLCSIEWRLGDQKAQ